MDPARLITVNVRYWFHPQIQLYGKGSEGGGGAGGGGGFQTCCSPYSGEGGPANTTP